MASPAPDRLGPYEILSSLGKGGMGEVWRARDPRLNREVAIKVSALQFTDRFEREAHAIASLNHPNICTLFDIGPNYLVMELVEGPTLAERVAEGPIPLEEALAIAKQIADALEAAHEKGIVHRDLKPGNVKIKPDGSVKVLDFGLAKIGGAAGVASSDSPTMMNLPTEVGVILGTAAYMAPEQARGKTVDKRADIWSFGVVLHEMLTGKRLFEGEDLADTLASVVKSDPDLTPVPAKVRRLLAKCLQKDPRKRLRDIGDAGILLEDTASATAPGLVNEPRSRLGKSVPWAVAVVSMVAAVGLGFVAWRYYSIEPQVMRITLQMPEKTQFSGYSYPMISPDGRHVAIAATVDGKAGLWLRDLDGFGARLLAGTEDAQYPFWSPDSRWVAFFADGKLKKIDITGGPVLTVCDAPNGGRSGTWNQDDVIVYAINPGALARVPAAGGTPVPLTQLDSAAGEVQHRFPSFLPDGRHFLYTGRNNDPEKNRIYVDSTDARPGSKTRREVLAAGSNAIYVPQARVAGLAGDGYLLFMRENTLMAQPFDAAQARTAGDAVPVAEQVDYFANVAQGQFSASQNGILVYASGAAGGANVQLTWFDRAGKPGGTVGDPGSIANASISPDGSTVAADRQGASGSRDIWLQDLARGTASRFTFGAVGNGSFRPVWSPDGSRIVFYSQRSGHAEPWEKAASGVGQEEILDKDPRPHYVTDWSRDGRYLIETVLDPKTRYDIWVIPTFGDRKPFPYVNAQFSERDAKLSPNGQFLAYVTTESLRGPEVYVQTFPEHGGKWQVSAGGGDFPVWSRDGRELYFISGDNKLMAVEVKADKGNAAKFEASVPRPLFDVRQSAQFDVSKNGRFLIHVPQDQTATNLPLKAVVNWQSALKK